MRYLFSQTSGNHTTHLIVEDYQIKDGVVYATKVARLAGWDDEHNEIYVKCSPVSFIAGGGPWNMTAYTGPIYEEEE
ncbi:MAG: hypothetical protein IKD76_01435 [Clostridia bacterium]|nr:hypothetical protein [Clostridia bacterium]